MYLKYIYIILIIVFFNNCFFKENNQYEPLETVPFVDIEKYMGKWYVIANIPSFVEKNATNATESYHLNNKGEIETIFSFYKNNLKGKKVTYTPKGFIYNTETNAEWKMQFIWPFKMPFLIIDLADDYSYTVVGYPNRKFVWIMSRTPKISHNIFQQIINDSGFE